MKPAFARSIAMHMHYAERTDAMDSRDPVLAPLARPLPRPWGQILAMAMVLGVSLVGIAAGVSVIGEMVR